MNYTRGKERPCWKGGRSSPTYQRIAFEDYNMERVCSVCGSTKKISVHHKDRDRRNNTRENLLILCDRCHKKEHISAMEMGCGLREYRPSPKIDHDMVCILFNSGKTVKDIANGFGYTPAGIRWILHKCGIQTPTKKYVEIDSEVVFRMLTDRKSIREIAIHLNTTHPRVSRFIQRELKDRKRYAVGDAV